MAVSFQYSFLTVSAIIFNMPANMWRLLDQ